uniref:C2H2-type domain-containing protein n=1 Tax=viral metagenome TaxID=1070528 RepID=A0A6C0ACU2_9ZZZZ
MDVDCDYSTCNMINDHMLLCPITLCKKKFILKNNLKNHIQIDHYYATRGGVTKFRFSTKDKLNILDCANSYLKVITQIYNDEIDGKEYAINLLPQVECPSDTEIKRIIKIQKSFAKKVIELNIIEKSNWVNVQKDFECFLRMGLPYYDTNFNPSLSIKFLWFSIMQKPLYYKKMCQKACGELIAHSIAEKTNEKEMDRFNYFQDVFEDIFDKCISVPDIKNNNSPTVFIDMRNNILNKNKEQLLQHQNIYLKKRRIL